LIKDAVNVKTSCFPLDIYRVYFCYK